MISFHNNSGALVALQTLGGSNSQLRSVQDSVSTGQTINTAADSAALWAISELMTSDLAGLRSVSDSLAMGEATVAVASAGAEQITETLSDMRALAIRASSGMGDFSKYEAAMAQKAEQISTVIDSAEFGGVNLLKTDVDGAGGTGLTVASEISGSFGLKTLTVEGVDFEGSPRFGIGSRTAITDRSSALTALEEIEGFMAYAADSAAALGSGAGQLAEQGTLVGRMTDSITRGVSAMVDTSLDEAATRLRALQAQQQLGTMALSIANTMPDNLRNLY